MIQLYEFPLSGHSHKARLLLSLLHLPYDSVVVRGTDREHKAAGFLAMNPFGQVPVLRDGDVVLRDSQAILTYLARRHGGDSWLPGDPVQHAQVAAWMATAANEMTRGPNALRLHHKFGRDIPVEEARQVTANLLNVLEARLSTHDWVALDHITIADIALFPYLALAPEADIDLGAHPHVVAWLARIQALDGYVNMPGIPDYRALLR
ncbi:MAG: glutathione S-transferase N-terminal domain-containing protein [Proteobacteria bacterium]|uniref:glutathione S-transferase family protein n=1 Tax=Aquabacterium sp. TaxID=1872578 RepID=UPI0035C74B3C|nr:glutathione S-transferase N-terminal domain-containing protein [Pseudomonadota bacterium]